MAQTILEFCMDPQKHEWIASVCGRLGIRVVQVEKKDYGQKLGTLAGISGFGREKTAYDGPQLPAEMLVFSGMNSDQVDAFLEAYREGGLPKVNLKAVITADNIFWTVNQLFMELMHEHLAFGAKYPSE